MNNKNYCLTEIPDLGDFSKFSNIETKVVYDDAFWDSIGKSIEKENKEYEKLCKNMEIDPISGKSTMSWEEKNREFNC